ncbi:MAG TPA: sigma-54 dependent transcriptional regulator [Polyangia bacterium]|nr:sigma-54 dependent transcriptional regulator [Polyangia bacterium]
MEEPRGVGARDPHRRKILVVDDEDEAREGLVEILRTEGYAVDAADTAEQALERFRAETYHLLLTDMLLPGKSGVDLTKIIHEAAPATAIVLITGHATVKTAVAALKRGASDYIRKPVNPKKLKERLQTLLGERPDYLPNRLLSVGRSGEVTFEGMLARSRVMHNVFEKIKLAAASDATVLITGESGTGKELVARAIHTRSSRTAGPFVAVHTGAIPRDLIASELFGHERGAFTGATERKEGKFEQSEAGTIFLDEISTMDERTQVGLLRVLESFTFTRIGGKKEKTANVRVVAATNKDLLKMVEEGAFREDLYYRLNILQIVLPPLRERREDIPLLATDFVTHFAAHYRKQVEVIPSETQRLLEGYHWPGNVRELRNVVEQAVLLARASTLDPELLPQMIYRAGPGDECIRISLGSTMHDAEKEIIMRTLEARSGNKKITAEVLGISRRSLYNKLAEYGYGKKLEEVGEEAELGADGTDGSEPRAGAGSGRTGS